MQPYQIIILIAVILIFGIIILPLFNRWQFKRLPVDQQVLAIMKQANKLVFWKNVSNGRSGNLFFVKNKRKFLFIRGCLMKTAEWLLLRKIPLIIGIIPKKNLRLMKQR